MVLTSLSLSNQTMMALFLQFLLVMLGLLMAKAQDQTGFISIDCGLPENSNYTEKTTGINYISDAKFIDAGVSKSISPAEKITLQQQLAYVRSFPSGVRNCYRITVTKGTKYLMRATFYYGNYDDLNELPQFELHLGANLWETVTFPNASLTTVSEIIYTPLLDYIQPCLVNKGTGTPFISAIELRTLKSDTYNIDSAGILAQVSRHDLGSKPNSEYRFRDDVYDRIWTSLPFKLWTQLSTTLSPNDLAQNDYKPPAVVMSTAATPVNASAPLKFYRDANNVNEQYYINMHFNEVQKLATNETRAFNITLNGVHWYDGAVVPQYQATSTIYSPTALTGATRYLISLVRTENSTLPPILNAYEIYVVKDFSQSETEQDDVDAITNIKDTYGLARNWQGDPCAPKAYIWEGLNCSFQSEIPPRITSLILSSSGLTGHIASSISKLTMLQYLDLSNNSLTGPIPDFLTHLQSLKVLKLGNNNLTGLVPSGLLDRSEKGSLSLSMEQNPNLCESASCNQQIHDKKKKNNIVIPLVASVAGILVLLVIAVAAMICCLKKRKLRAVNSHAEPNTPNVSPFESKQRQYTYNDLAMITNNFSRTLGKGGFGTVYHGLIDGTEVAVKVPSPSSVQGYPQFVAEVKLLMTVHHKNLTSLVGYCNEENNIGLIYEYMANGNLDEHLSGKTSLEKFLTWEDRLRIAVNAAQGLEYLHNGCKPPIIHRDVKSTNILLNENFEAKLADFGLSKNLPADGGTHLSTVVAGTPGYLDPEYWSSNRLTEKSDVYSFGVVLLEIITGQPAIVKTPEKITNIKDWVSSMLSNGDIESIVDSRLQEDFDTSSVWKAVDIGMACVSPARTRPSMRDVVTELKASLATELDRKRTGSEIEKDSMELVSLNLNLTTELGPPAR